MTKPQGTFKVHKLLTRLTLLALLFTLVGCTIHINQLPPMPEGKRVLVPSSNLPQSMGGQPGMVTGQISADNGSLAARMQGSWAEQWPGRMGCQDIARITNRGGRLKLSGGDCNTDESYRFSNERIVNGALRFRLLVVSTDISYEYTMRLSADGQRMNGEAVEEDGSVTELRWTRQ